MKTKVIAGIKNPLEQGIHWSASVYSRLLQSPFSNADWLGGMKESFEAYNLHNGYKGIKSISVVMEPGSFYKEEDSKILEELKNIPDNALVYIRVAYSSPDVISYRDKVFVMPKYTAENAIKGERRKHVIGLLEFGISEVFYGTEEVVFQMERIYTSHNSAMQVELNRMAVNQDFEGLGIGSFLFSNYMKYIEEYFSDGIVYAEIAHEATRKMFEQYMSYPITRHPEKPKFKKVDWEHRIDFWGHPPESVIISKDVDADILLQRLESRQHAKKLVADFEQELHRKVQSGLNAIKNEYIDLMKIEVKKQWGATRRRKKIRNRLSKAFDEQFLLTLHKAIVLGDSDEKAVAKATSEAKKAVEKEYDNSMKSMSFFKFF